MEKVRILTLIVVAAVFFVIRIVSKVPVPNTKEEQHGRNQE